MTFIEDMRDGIDRLAAFGELDVEASRLPSSMVQLSDSSLRDLLSEVGRMARGVAVLQAVLAGLVAQRSSRDRGHGGFASETGHRSPVELIRDINGATRGEATRAVRVGESLLDGVGADTPSGPPGDSGGVVPSGDASPAPWHEPLRVALLAGRITTAQHHAIKTGLGAPPKLDGRDSDVVELAWRAAARELVAESASCTVEELGSRARVLRDALDPAGAEERYAARFANRSYRWSVSPDGQHRAYITFDDEMGLWVREMMDAALRPRRGGPRFVSSEERDAADALIADPRTNDQLAYDLFIDVLRAGALADAKDVFGAREPGVRLIAMRDAVTGDSATRDPFDRLIAAAHSEDGTVALPGSALERALCVRGAVTATFDTAGNPLDLGREQRLFDRRQRLVLAVRDGGCLWPGCDRPPAFCEAHHCDHWSEGGRTDCSVGVLLCAYHHLHLHNAGWRIVRHATRGFLLHPPPGVGGEPIPLASKSPLRRLWDPPPYRAGWRDVA